MGCATRSIPSQGYVLGVGARVGEERMASHVQTDSKRTPGPAEEERPCKIKICVAKKQAVVPRVPKVSQLRIGRADWRAAAGRGRAETR